jgi:Baseplate J-like protein.
MKTAILQLESYDNRFSICDKMGAGHVDRVLLVWPKRAKRLLDEQDLIYIRRQAQNLGLQLAFVCHEDCVLAWAEGLAISVFPSVPAAQTAHWQTIHSKLILREEADLPKPSLRRDAPAKNITGHPVFKRAVQIVSLVLGAAAILALLIFLIPSATVTIYPQTHTKQITVQVSASPQFHEVNLNGNLPAFQKQVEVSGSLSGLSTGTTGIPSTAAAGLVTLTNLTNAPIELPKGTIITTGAEPVLRYSTDTEVTIPAGANATASVGVTAQQAGESGNQPTGALTVVEGIWGAELNVTNAAPLSGGQDQQSPAPTEADYTNLQSKLLQQLSLQAAAEIESSGEKLIPHTLSAGEVTSSVRSLDPGQPGEQINLTLTVRFTGLVYEQQDLEHLLDGALAASLASNEVNYSGAVHSSLQNSVEVASDNVAKWQETVTAQVGPSVEADALTELLAGKSRDEATVLLQSRFPSQHLPQISIYPFNFLRLPFAAYRIRIQVGS